MDKTLVVLGSGGHTAEMLRMARGGIAHGLHCPDDALALRLALPHRTVVPRPRRVRQSWLTTPLTVLWSLIVCVVALVRKRTAARYDAIACNGPAICVVVALADRIAALLLRQRRAPVVYVESLARVSGLSLSGRAMRLLADRVYVQWPGLAQPDTRRLAPCVYRGLLV